MNKLLSALIAAAGICLAFSAVAGEGRMDKKTAEMMDENKDGMISKAEYMKHSKDVAMWDKMDKNKDGMLDPTELGFQEKQ